MARRCSTVCLPIRQDAYDQVVADPVRFRAWLDDAFRANPELFPEAFTQGYRLKDDRVSAKTGARLRRVRLAATGETLSVRLSFVLPYQVGTTLDVEKPLVLRSFGVPFWALARVFGHDAMYWYRLEVSLGRNLHGSPEACERHARAWALLYNYRPWHPATAKTNGGWRSPAERLNRHRYHDCWLQNLLVSASLSGYRR